MKVMVFGTFDRLHLGHQFVLDQASARGELHVVIARDANVERIKGHLPTQNQEERMKAVQEAFPHAKVILGDPKDFLAPVRAVSPELILLGYDQKLPPNVAEIDLPCPVERVAAYKPEQYKSHFS